MRSNLCTSLVIVLLNIFVLFVSWYCCYRFVVRKHHQDVLGECLGLFLRWIGTYMDLCMASLLRGSVVFILWAVFVSPIVVCHNVLLLFDWINQFYWLTKARLFNVQLHMHMRTDMLAVYLLD